MIARLALAALILSGVGCHKRAAVTTGAEGAIPRMGDLELWREYRRSNIAAADMKWKGKTVELLVAGRVTKDAIDDFYILDCRTKDDGINERGVVCWMLNRSVEAISKLEDWQPCVIRGRVRERSHVLDDYPDNFYLIIERCDLVEVLPAPQPKAATRRTSSGN